MKLFPAIDLRGGQVVRLTQGDYDRMTVYGADPAAQAAAFRQAGASCLHLVDLDGAKDGAPANFEAIRAIARQGGLYIEVGGGIRTEQRIEDYLALGVGRCILGSVAAIHGWRETSAEDGLAFCRRLADAGCTAVIVTDIARDGAMQGTNLELYRRIRQELPGLALTASGGIRRMEELDALDQMGAAAAILGKSLYAGALDLAACVRRYEKKGSQL